MRIITIVTFLLLGLKITAQEIVTDRPDQTESSSTVPLKSLQIESGILNSMTNNSGLKERQLLIPTTLLRYGITKNLELRLGEQFALGKTSLETDNTFGASDLELGVKIQILRKEDINTEIAFVSHLVLPTGSENLTSGTFGTVNKIAVSHSITDFMGFGYNLGYNYFGEGSGIVTYSFALGVGISEKIGFYAEPYGEIPDFKDPVLNFDSGITYLIKENLQLDLSFGTGLNHKMYYYSIGCSWNIRKSK